MTIIEGPPQPVVIDYNDLINGNVDLSEKISAGFGNAEGCLGIVVISNLPESYQPMRERLLQLASRFAHLPEENKAKVVHKPPFFFGWSHGKEVIEGKPDFAKGSYYNNPIYDHPPTDDPNYVESYPAYGYDNIWPKEDLPELQPAFMDLGSFIVGVGLKLAVHCDKFIAKHHPDLPAHLVVSAIKESITHKVRLDDCFHV
jgi:isopenicillin N synthase-like dioxygenase